MAKLTFDPQLNATYYDCYSIFNNVHWVHATHPPDAWEHMVNKMLVVSAAVGQRPVGQKDKWPVKVQCERDSARESHPSTQPRLLSNAENTANFSEKETTQGPLPRPPEAGRI